MENRNYTVSDLVQNASFRRLVNGAAGAAEIDYWSHWMEQSDENRKKAKEAIAKMVGFKLVDPLQKISEPDFEKEWAKLQRATLGKSRSQHVHFFTVENSFRWVYRAAAIFLLGSIVSLGVWLYSQNVFTTGQPDQIASVDTVTTPNGQQKTLTFSNGAKIVMNNNSAMSYSIGKKSDHAIRVNMMAGEAFFSDKRSAGGTAGHRIFTVTTPDGVVKDIGTEFVVTVKKSGSRVVLQNGHVRIETVNNGKRVRQYDMKKGEMVIFKKAHILKKETVNPTFYTAWATGFMQFNHTTVREFARYVEKRFKVKVVITNPELDNVTMDGAVYFRSLERLVRAVSDATQIPVYRSKNRDTVYIGNLNRRSK